MSHLWQLLREVNWRTVLSFVGISTLGSTIYGTFKLFYNHVQHKKHDRIEIPLLEKEKQRLVQEKADRMDSEREKIREEERQITNEVSANGLRTSGLATRRIQQLHDRLPKTIRGIELKYDIESKKIDLKIEKLRHRVL